MLSYFSKIMMVILDNPVKISGEQLNQNFHRKIDDNGKWTNPKLNHIFNVVENKNDWIVAFIYYLSSYNNPVEKFGNSWKCLNHIIDVVCADTKGDRQKVDALLIQLESELNNLKETRLIKWGISNKKNFDSFMTTTGADKYKDTVLMSKLLGAFDKAFKSVDIDNLSKNERKHYKGDKKKFKRAVYGPEIDNEFNYVKTFLRYCVYLRNKYFHGEYGPENIILKSNEAMDELNEAASILQLIDKELLDNVFFDKLLKRRNYYPTEGYEQVLPE